MAVDFGFVLPAGPPKGQIKQWLDNLDTLLPQLTDHFNSIWMTDHFQWEDNPVYEAWTVLAFAAARWPQYDLGPIVLGQSYRNPAMLAKMGATLQILSGGRLIMAVGAGWKEDEYHAFDYPFPSAKIRLEQLEDTLEILKRMWTEPGPVTYRGQHYKIQKAYCEPKPDPAPILMVGGGGYKTTLLAAKYADRWNMYDSDFAVYNERLAFLKEHCEKLGRDITSIPQSWFGRLAVAKTEAEAIALSNGKWTKEKAFVGTPQQVIDLMGPFVESGISGFIVEVLGIDNPDLRGMVLEEVLPTVRTL